MAEVTQADLANMTVEERANTLADAGKGDPWELVGYFREKARQAEDQLKAEKEASAKFFAAHHRTEAAKPLVEALEKAEILGTKHKGYGMSFRSNGISGHAEIELYGPQADAAHWFIVNVEQIRAALRSVQS